MIRKVLLGLGVLVALVGVLAVVVALQPAQFRVARAATISAPAEVVFAQVNDLHKWEAWSPWAKLDPAAKNTFEGPSAGKGAVFAWDGNDKVGAGRMTIIESRPNERVRLELVFVRPFAGTCTIEITFQSEGKQTEVNWAMTGENNFLAKAVHLCMNMDKTVGGDFEKGLASLKEVSEAATRKEGRGVVAGPSKEPEQGTR